MPIFTVFFFLFLVAVAKLKISSPDDTTALRLLAVGIITFCMKALFRAEVEFGFVSCDIYNFSATHAQKLL